MSENSLPYFVVYCMHGIQERLYTSYSWFQVQSKGSMGACEAET